MTNRDRTSGGLNRENARIRRERNAARDALAARERILHDYQLEGVACRLSGRLLMEDFEDFIGLENALDQDGRIDAWKLEQHVAALLLKRPGLALSASGNAGRSGLELERRDEAESGTASSDRSEFPEVGAHR